MRTMRAVIVSLFVLGVVILLSPVEGRTIVVDDDWDGAAHSRTLREIARDDQLGIESGDSPFFAPRDIATWTRPRVRYRPAQVRPRPSCQKTASAPAAPLNRRN